MTEHIAIQDPSDYTAEDMMTFAERLFAPGTPTEELERICMLLAHLPTEDAQRLLGRFRESTRAAEVEWLECAVDEGAFHLLSPCNELEEREFLVLKVIEEIDDEIIDLEGQRDELDLKLRKHEIRRGAIDALIAAGSLAPDEAIGLDDAMAELRQELAACLDRIEAQETIALYLRHSITTPRYRDADPSVVRHIHLL